MFRFYSRPPLTKSRVSVVADIREDLYHIAVSRCSAKDQFLKKKGRAIAEGRLAKGKVYATHPVKTGKTGEFIAIAKQVAMEVDESKIVY
jgi:hypothetical protein